MINEPFLQASWFAVHVINYVDAKFCPNQMNGDPNVEHILLCSLLYHCNKVVNRASCRSQNTCNIYLFVRIRIFLKHTLFIWAIEKVNNGQTSPKAYCKNIFLLNYYVNRLDNQIQISYKYHMLSKTSEITHLTKTPLPIYE